MGTFFESLYWGAIPVGRILDFILGFVILGILTISGYELFNKVTDYEGNITFEGCGCFVSSVSIFTTIFVVVYLLDKLNLSEYGGVWTFFFGIGFYPYVLILLYLIKKILDDLFK